MIEKMFERAMLKMVDRVMASRYSGVVLMVISSVMVIFICSGQFWG